MKNGFEQTTELMQSLAASIDDILNGDAKEKSIGFALFIFPFNGIEGARTNYISNAVRKDMIIAMKEVLARFDGQADVKGRA